MMRRLYFRLAAVLALAGALIPGASAQTAPVQNAAPPDATTLLPPVRTFRLPSRIGVFGEARITLQQAPDSLLIFYKKR